MYIRSQFHKHASSGSYTAPTVITSSTNSGSYTAPTDYNVHRCRKLHGAHWLQVPQIQAAARRPMDDKNSQTILEFRSRSILGPSLRSKSTWHIWSKVPHVRAATQRPTDPDSFTAPYRMKTNTFQGSGTKCSRWWSFWYGIAHKLINCVK